MGAGGNLKRSMTIIIMNEIIILVCMKIIMIRENVMVFFFT